jgi:psiF repeat
MRILVALAVVAVLGGGAALAADTPHPTTTVTPSGAKATPVKNSLKACNKRADAKNLTGPQRSAFVKNCRVGKPQG